MVPGWWLLVEAGAFVAYAWALRGWTRNAAMFYAVNDPTAAKAKLDRLPEGYRRKLLRTYVRHGSP